MLSLADQPNAGERCADLYGRRMGFVPYIMPGFRLAKKAAEVFEEDPAVEGLVLLKHGVFTFGDTAQEAYQRMIAVVSRAEEELSRGRKTVFARRRCPRRSRRPPMWRRSCGARAPFPIRPARGRLKRFILEFRSNPAVLGYVNGADLQRYGQAGVATPDHTIRTKNYPLIVPAPEAGRLDAFKAAAGAAVDRFAADYHAYFARHNPRQEAPKRELDPMPRVILVPGLGLFGLGRSAKDARIAADIAEATIETVTGAERSAASSRSARPTFSTSNIGRSNKRSSGRAARRRSPAKSRSSPAAPARSALRRRGDDRRRGRGGGARYQGRARRCEKAAVGRRSGSIAT